MSEVEKGDKMILPRNKCGLAYKQIKVTTIVWQDVKAVAHMLHTHILILKFEGEGAEAQV